MLANDLKVLEARVPEARRATLAAEAEQWHRKHPLALAFVYRDGGSKLFPASARAVADEELHAGRLVFPPAA